MISSRIPLAAAGIAAGAMVLQTLLEVVESSLSLLTLNGVDDRTVLYSALTVQLGIELGEDVLFGLGLFLSFSYLQRVVADDSWRRVLRAGLIASVIGIVGVVVIGVLLTIVNSFSAGAHPFGYSFTPTFDSASAEVRLISVIEPILGRIVELLALGVIAAGLQKIWRQRATSAPAGLAEATSRASRAE